MRGELPIEAGPGKAMGDGIAAHVDAHGVGADLRLNPMPIEAYLPVVIENAQRNWDVWLVDRTREEPNWRQLPKVAQTAYAILPCDTKRDYFLGHAILADPETGKDLVISLCNLLPGKWLVSLHNPTDQPITTKVRSAPTWPVFKLDPREITVPAGASLDIPVP
jgi:hypothetical protein